MDFLKKLGIWNLLKSPPQPIDKIVIKANIMPKPVGLGSTCILLLFGKSMNFSLSLKINNFINLLLIKNEMIIRKKLIKNIIYLIFVFNGNLVLFSP